MASSEGAKYDGSEMILLDEEYLNCQQLPIFFPGIGFHQPHLIFKGERNILGYWDIGMIGFVLLVPGVMQ